MSWDRRVDCFEVHKVKRIFQTSQFLAQFRAEPRLSLLDAGARPPLALVERVVVRYVMDGFDAHLLQFLDGVRVDSWQVANVVIRAWRIATVVELVSSGVGSMATGRKVVSFGLVEDHEKRPQPEGELVLLFVNAERHVPNPANA